jgi:hypothetical protein
VNHRRPWWIVFSLLPPLIALCALIIPFGCGGGGSSSATATPTPASVAIALVGVPPPGNFRSILLNISGVRINKTANADQAASGWTTISVPSLAGSGNGQSPGDLQLDLLNTQTGAVFFNVGGAQQGTYQTVQVLVDTTNPGTIIPACQSGVSNTEGCINYPMTFNTLALPLIFPLATPLSVSANATAPLVIQLAVSIAAFPVNTGDPYMVTITPSETNAGSFLAAVSGNVTVKGTPNAVHVTPLSVSAELSGTNTVIETVPVKAKGFYTLELPAAPSGTSYDIFTTGGASTFAALQGITVIPGQFIGGMDLTTTGTSLGALTGIIADACTGIGIPGAQLELLAPAANVTVLPTPRPTPPASFCFDNPGQCVVVASASADQGGNYPMPGTTKNPTGFDEIPVGQSDFAVQVNASGYSSLSSSMFLRTNKNEICSAATSPTVCSFSLSTGYINGTVNLVSDPPPGSSVVVQVFAENNGTNQLVSALLQPLTFLNHQTSLPFTLNVPINQPVSGVTPPFDLFAVAIDPFQGGPGPFPGHDIPVLANQPAPTAGCQQMTAAAFEAMNCVGHGSISGTVQNADTGTSVEVEKLDPSNTPVQVLGTSPALFSSNSPSNNAYTLCVPPDTYALQRFEAAPTSSATPSATPIPVGTPQPVMVPQPAATSSPCPSTCSNTNSGSAPCPGICSGTAASPL